MITLIQTCFVLAKKILSDQNDDLPPLFEQLEEFGLSAEVVHPIIDMVMAKKDNIYLAAQAITGR